MMPPNCSICREDCFEDGKLVYFAETEEDKIGNERLRQPGFTGHPPNAFWFCGKHFEEAAKLENLTKYEAFKVLKEVFKV
jgi:hypothetical protein